MAAVRDLPIIGFFDRQRFAQFNPADTANWYLVADDQGKKKVSMYPVMGRRHVRFLEQNKLVFAATPRGEFKSINFAYIVVVNSIFRVDSLFNLVEITGGQFTTFSGNVFFTYLVTPAVTYAVFADGQHIYVFNEETLQFSVITDPNAPANPTYVAAFGNRVVAAGGNTSEFRLSEINLAGGPGGTFDAALAWTINGAAVFAQEAGIIKQFGVLHNTLYIFTDYTTGIWANIPSVFVSFAGIETTFPWKKNTTFDWDYGMADPLSLDIDFGMMCWLAQNRNGIFQVMASIGDAPKDLTTQAIDVMFQRDEDMPIDNPFRLKNADGFLYVYENTIFYRLSVGNFQNTGLLDFVNQNNSIEYNFSTQSWHRCIEKNGERCRIQKHVFFNNMHLVTVLNDNTVYEMSGAFYTNDITNPDQPDPQAVDAYIAEPFRYERVTPIIYEPDYSEFEDEYVEIDFVWGDRTFINSTNPFENAEFIIDEEAGSDGSPVFLIDEESSGTEPVYLITQEGNQPVLNSPTYHTWFKPHIELYYSDDGGVSFLPADVREFSQLGVYKWRMRWYQLGPSRNRVYKLICISPSPIVVLGGVRMTRRLSGGAN